MAVYKGKPEKAQRTVRTMIGALVPVLLLTAGQAMAQLTSEGNQLWHQDSDGIAGRAERGDQFGGTLVTGDFNNDGFEDLAIGVSNEDPGGEGIAGAVNVIYGGPAGLAAPGNQIWHQDSEGIAGEADRFDSFGFEMAAADFNNDGFEDLAIGNPSESLGIVTDSLAGAVNVIYGGPDGLTALGNQIWHQDSNGIAGGAESFDDFGDALAAADFNNDGFEDLAIGVPREDLGGIEDAGAVNVIYGGPDGLAAPGNQIWHQDSDSIAGQAEEVDRFGDALAAGDFNNDGFEDLAIGVPFEDLGGIQGAGAVNVIYGFRGGLFAFGNQIWGQDSVGIGGRAGVGDHFGEALAAGDFNNDGFDDLAIGVHGEGPDAGAVNVIYGGPGGLAATGSQIWRQGSGGIAGQAAVGDNFGEALAAGHFNSDGFEDLAIGVDGEDIGGIQDAGVVNVIYGGPSGLAAPGNQICHQDSDGIAGGAAERDLFGRNLAAGDFNDDGLEDLAIWVPLEDIGNVRFAGAVNVLYGAGPAPLQFSSEGIVSAASFLPGAAPAAIMSLFGENLAAATEVASEVPLPASLAGTTLRVTAEPVIAQTSQILRGALAPLFFASPGQINFLMPPVPLGPARVTVIRTDGSSFSARIEIERVAPALFSADASGSGVAAALFLRVAADGTRTQDLIFDPNTLAAVPIDLGSEQDQVFLALFGTGIRGFTSEVTARVGGVEALVLGAVPLKQFEGVDQVNIGPLNLEGAAGLGNAGGRTLAIILSVDGRQTNPVVFLVKPDPLPGGPRPPGPMPGPVGLE